MVPVWKLSAAGLIIWFAGSRWWLWLLLTVGTCAMIWKVRRLLFVCALRRKFGRWAKTQAQLRLLISSRDAACLADDFQRLQYVGGVDISFVPNSERAVATLVVCSYPHLRVLDTYHLEAEMTEPYKSGFLAFREAPILLKLLDTIKEDRAFPQILFVDGNGRLHPRSFGLACHLGVLADVPTIGVGKKLHLVDGMDKVRQQQRFCAAREKADRLDHGFALPVVGTSGRVWGSALASGGTVKNPVYISVGHRVSLKTATTLAGRCSRFRIPSPFGWRTSCCDNTFGSSSQLRDPRSVAPAARIKRRPLNKQAYNVVFCSMHAAEARAALRPDGCKQRVRHAGAGRARPPGREVAHHGPDDADGEDAGSGRVCADVPAVAVVHRSRRRRPWV
jgi:endonuclease V